MMLPSHPSAADMARYLESSETYPGYRESLRIAAEKVKAGEVVQIEKAELLPLNFQRVIRNEKTFELSPELKQLLDNIKGPSYWLVITEIWCGDSAQCVPGLYKISEASKGKINFSVIGRDVFPELMNAFLTKGSRSIPKLIQLDEKLNVTGLWGPRPSPAQELVLRIQNDPLTVPHYQEELHRWYAKDKMNTLQSEIAHLLKQQDPVSS